MSTPFRTDLADLEFLFFDQLDVPGVLGAASKYEHLDRDTYAATFAEAARVATEVLHPINRGGDVEGCRLDDEGNVTTPAGFATAWQRMAEGGWIVPDAPAAFGGAGLPHAVAAAVNDLFIGASVAFMMYPGLTAGAARMIEAFGDERYRELVATKLFTGAWSGTMCLTEAGAGSAVGDNRARAERLPGEDGVFLLTGEKIFISGGDSDMVENVIHLVLARTPDSPAGTKGLSLFLVPKIEFLHASASGVADGTLGARNGAKVVGIEHKMGINGSSTCTLALGSDRPCKGWLIGREREGIAQMFKMMNEARIAVAGQGAAIAGAAYNYAVQYARDRVQGSPLTAKSEDDRVAIAQHPDVRRMLMTLKVVAETSRAACVRMAFDLDRAETDPDAETQKRLRERADLLIPVLKAHCTDLGFEMAVLAVQVYGGYGFIREYPVEQLVRDAKIQSIYEGTNGIQALDLLGRKLRIRGGALFGQWLEDAKSTLALGARAGFIEAAEKLGTALGELGKSAMHLGQTAGAGHVDGAFVFAVPFLKAFGVVLLGLEAFDQARVARGLLDRDASHPAARLWHGKLRNLEFYVAHLLPHAIAYAKSTQSGDESCLDAALFRL